MQDLNDLFYFARVVEAGGFAAAGRQLGIQWRAEGSNFSGAIGGGSTSEPAYAASSFSSFITSIITGRRSLRSPCSRRALRATTRGSC